jgi:hypothetical protein
VSSSTPTATRSACGSPHKRSRCAAAMDEDEPGRQWAEFQRSLPVDPEAEARAADMFERLPLSEEDHEHKRLRRGRGMSVVAAARGRAVWRVPS